MGSESLRLRLLSMDCVCGELPMAGQDSSIEYIEWLPVARMDCYSPSTHSSVMHNPVMVTPS